MERRRINRNTNQPFEAPVLDVRDIAQQIWKRKFLTLVLIAIPSLAGFLYLVTRPDIYQSTAVVLLEDSGVKIADVEEAFPGMQFDEVTSQTQARILQSPELMRSVIRGLGLRIDESGDLTSASLAKDSKDVTAAPEKDSPEEYATLAKYSQGLNIAPVKNTRVINITFSAGNPYLAAEVANGHMKHYVQSQIEVQKNQASQLNEWIAQQVEILKKQSAEKSLAVQKFRTENNMVKGRAESDLIYQQVSDIAAQLIPVQARKADLQAQVDAIEAAGGKVSLSMIQDSSVIQGLKGQAAAARQELRALSATYGKNHPLYVEAQRRAAQAESDLARETASIRETTVNELETVTAQEELLNQQLEDLKAEADTQRQKQIELEGLELEAAASTKLLDSFIARYEEISSQLDFARPHVRELTAAEVPMAPMGGNKAMKMVVILFVSTVFACGIVFLISLADRGVKSVDDVRKLLQLRFLGVLPDVRNPVAEILSGNRSTYFEEIKRIYLHLSGKPQVKTVLLTAASAGEGKSSMALALATYLVSLGHRVLVIDADLRTPDIARLANVDETPGLSDVLSGKMIASSAIRRDERGISILPAGHDVEGQVDLLTAERLRGLIDGLKESYDYILLDSAPVLASSDAETAARVVDMVIMVVAYARTSRKNLKKAAETLRQFAPEMPSVILNKADLKNVA